MLLRDGFSTVIRLLYPTPPGGITSIGRAPPAAGAWIDAVPILFKEMEVTPPGIEGGGKIDITGMRNLVMRTDSPKQLLSIDDVEVDVEFDVQFYTDILFCTNVNCHIQTIFLYDGSGVEICGWLNSFKPEKRQEGKDPRAKIMIHASNLDPNSVSTVSGRTDLTEFKPIVYLPGTFSLVNGNIT